jgi:hypothetical protein
MSREGVVANARQPWVVRAGIFSPAPRQRHSRPDALLRPHSLAPLMKRESVATSRRNIWEIGCQWPQDSRPLIVHTAARHIRRPRLPRAHACVSPGKSTRALLATKEPPSFAGRSKDGRSGRQGPRPYIWEPCAFAPTSRQEMIFAGEAWFHQGTTLDQNPTIATPTRLHREAWSAPLDLPRLLKATHLHQVQKETKT